MKNLYKKEKKHREEGGGGREEEEEEETFAYSQLRSAAWELIPFWSLSRTQLS